MVQSKQRTKNDRKVFPVVKAVSDKLGFSVLLMDNMTLRAIITNIFGVVCSVSSKESCSQIISQLIRV